MANELFPYQSMHRYQLIIDLPVSVKKKLFDIRKKLSHDHPGSYINGGLPLIYLADFKQTESQEQQMTDALNTVALGFMPFKIHLKNFGHIDQREIFLAIENRVPVNVLVSHLKGIATHLMDAKFNEHPRVSIIKKNS